MKEWTEEQFEWAKKRSSALYVYTPMCGTCLVASKMMEVVAHLVPKRNIGQMNVNYHSQLALDYEIESVPCLLIFDEGELTKKVYAFQSVPFLYELLKIN